MTVQGGIGVADSMSVCVKWIIGTHAWSELL